MRSLPALLLLATVAHAEPITLRMATLAPDGTVWSHELRAAARELEERTVGQVRIKWIFGGVAGDEAQVLDRVARGQLDGGAFTYVCDELAPTLRVMRIPGIVNSREEERFLTTRLRPAVEADMAQRGFAYLGSGSIGQAMLFSKTPVTSFADVKRLRWFAPLGDHMVIDVAAALGIPVVPMGFGEAVAAADEGRIDGFYTVAAGVLAFQLLNHARYFTTLGMGTVTACAVLSQRSFLRLAAEYRADVIAVTTKGLIRVCDQAAQEEPRVLDLLVKHGVVRFNPPEMMRFELHAAVREVRERVVDPSLLTKVLALLADYRAEHR